MKCVVCSGGAFGKLYSRVTENVSPAVIEVNSVKLVCAIVPVPEIALANMLLPNSSFPPALEALLGRSSWSDPKDSGELFVMR